MVALTTLLSLAQVVRLEITRVECRHASIRRLAKMKSNTHPASLAQVSAQYVLQQAQHMQSKTLPTPGSSTLVAEEAPDRQCSRDVRRVRKKGKQRQRVGGGGVHRALVSQWVC